MSSKLDLSNYTDEEIRRELIGLGIRDVPKEIKSTERDYYLKKLTDIVNRKSIFG